MSTSLMNCPKPGQKPLPDDVAKIVKKIQLKHQSKPIKQFNALMNCPKPGQKPLPDDVANIVKKIQLKYQN